MRYRTSKASRHDRPLTAHAAGGTAQMLSAVTMSGRDVELDTAVERAGYACMAVSSLANLQVRAPAFSFWVQVRGACRVESEEGGFRLRRGDWIAFERDSLPELQAEHRSLTLGLVLMRDAMGQGVVTDTGVLYPGRGAMPLAELRLWTRLWRACTRLDPGDVAAANRKLKPMLLHAGAMQQQLANLVARCPGRSMKRKSQIFARLQRVHMCMEGNPHRMVRQEELVRFALASNWWLSKIFHQVYGESAQQVSMRLRMTRACDLLENTGLSISELGEACGFHDPCSFARQFKAYHGRTASAWRMASRDSSPSPLRDATGARDELSAPGNSLSCFA